MSKQIWDLELVDGTTNKIIEKQLLVSDEYELNKLIKDKKLIVKNKKKNTFATLKENIFSSKNKYKNSEMLMFFTALYDAENTGIKDGKEKEEFLFEIFEINKNEKSMFSNNKFKRFVEKFVGQLNIGIPEFEILKNLGIEKMIYELVRMGLESSQKKLLYKEIIEIYQNRIETEKTVKKALREPKIQLGAIMLAFSIFVLKVFPSFKEMRDYINMDNVFFLTKYLMDISEWAVNNMMLFGLGMAGVGVAFYYVIIYFFKILIPYVPFTKKVVLYQNYTTLFTILKTTSTAQLQDPVAIEFALNSVSDMKTKTFLHEVLQKVKKGENFYLLLRESKKFIPEVNGLLKGIASGSDKHQKFEQIITYYKSRGKDEEEKLFNILNVIKLIVISSFIMLLYFSLVSVSQNVSTNGDTTTKEK